MDGDEMALGWMDGDEIALGWIDGWMDGWR